MLRLATDGHISLNCSEWKNRTKYRSTYSLQATMFHSLRISTHSILISGNSNMKSSGTRWIKENASIVQYISWCASGHAFFWYACNHADHFFGEWLFRNFLAHAVCEPSKCTETLETGTARAIDKAKSGFQAGWNLNHTFQAHIELT